MLISVCVGSVRGKTLPHLVDSIIAQRFHNWELIVSAQGNDEAMLAYLEKISKQDSRIFFLHLNRFGRSHALNQAAKVAKGDILAFTDDDCIAAPDWLAITMQNFLDDSSIGLVAGDLVPPPGRQPLLSVCPATRTIEYVYRPAKENFRGPPGFYWGGANFAVRRSVFDLVGPFDEYLGVGTDFPSAEDVDFGVRAEALDIAMHTTPRSIIHHTYGRRHGLKNVLKHHRAYAMGSGALGGKLTLWGHHLAQEWSLDATVGTSLKRIIKNPPRGLLASYIAYYYNLGKAAYLASFDIDEQHLSRSKKK